MDAQRLEDITEWDARSFSDGFAGLRRLADRGFSGAATDGTGWLFLLNGRVVGVVDADLDAFADASGTAYQAPEEELPLLFAMLERGGEKRAQYYTNDTPLSEADRKLSAGGFTGYVELSENVLSGDYYLTYTGGDSRAAAYVGNSRRLETGDDAFALADDEVGIYTVYEVDLDVRELPEPDAGTAATANGDVAADADAAAADADVDDVDDGDDATDGTNDTDASVAADADPDGTAAETTDSDGTTAKTIDTAAETVDRADGEEGAKAVDADASAIEADDGGTDSDEEGKGGGGDGTDRSAETETETGTNRAATEGAKRGSEPEPGPKPGTEPGPEPSPGGAAESEAGAGSTAEGPAGNGGPGEDVFSEEEEWREAKSIPALDPKEASERRQRGRTDAHDGEARNAGPARSRSAGAGSPEGTRQGSATAADGSSRSSQSTRRDANAPPEPRASDRSGQAAVSKRPAVQRSQLQREVQRLEAALSDAESARDEAAAERDEAVTERDEIAAERDEHEREVRRLESELADVREERDRLRDRLADLEAELPDAERSIPAARARGETNLFIRYGSKGGVTLEDVHDGNADREALRENIRIEHHTGFESEGAVVDGVPFTEFLEGTMEYGFTRWLVEDLPFEIADTGNEGTLRDLYDALPEVDRAEIGGSVSVVTRENGEENREQRAFDLVLRDRMGNPLFIADLNDSREPTVEGTLESLVANGGDIGESNDSFAAAFAVTASFFEPGALEAASDAVGGGLFSRSKRASFVKLSRKRGYHLCLVESRDGGFHLTVPDL